MGRAVGNLEDQVVEPIVGRAVEDTMDRGVEVTMIKAKDMVHLHHRTHMALTIIILVRQRVDMDDLHQIDKTQAITDAFLNLNDNILPTPHDR